MASGVLYSPALLLKQAVFWEVTLVIRTTASGIIP